KILFFGNERLVSGLKSTEAPVLRGLIERGYTVSAIISHHHDTRSRNNRELEVAEIGKQYNIPVLLPNKPTEIIDQIVGFNAEAAVLVAYGRIIPQRVIDLFPKGIVNIHPSLLPKYRGPTPIESAILNGDTETGVSLMQLTAGMDSGPIFGQTQLSLKGTENKFDIYNQLSQKGAELLFTLLPPILDGSLQPTPQDEINTTYCQLLSKEDALLNFAELTAVEAERRIRAFLGFPKTKATIAGHTVIITKAHVTSAGGTLLDIPCKGGDFLSIDELIAPSGRSMTGRAFLQGYAA
ncbi:MAG TPA: methionyl-tRNA formyltransferase, partial [Candidatus Saccharimonadales bacterium]|nr:methionyl-tRNA formyltransferase [Candidatus Saccharimonadales bacterium]